MVGAQSGVGVVGAHPSHDGVEWGEVSLPQVGRGKQRDACAELADGIRHSVAHTHDVADILRGDFDVGAH